MKIQIIRQDKRRFDKLGLLEEKLLTLQKYLKAGKRFKTDLRPWFMVLGEEAAQQEWLQALKLDLRWQSNRQLSADKMENINIYCSIEAIFLDVSESLWQTKPQNEQTRSHWQSFLKQVRGCRSFGAPRGIVICIGLCTLKEHKKISSLLENLQIALREFAEMHFAKVPVYLVYTGLQTVEGFAEYMQLAGTEQKEQIFGFSNPLVEKNLFNELAELKNLHQRLNEKLLAKFRWGESPVKNSVAFFYPEMLATYYPVIAKCSEALVHASPNPDQLLIRGIYFIAKDFNSQECYFTRTLLDEVLIRDIKRFSALEGFNEWLERHRRRLITILGAGFIFVLSIWWFGVLHDQAYLDSMSDRLNTFSASQTAIQNLENLQQLYDLGKNEDHLMFRYLGIFFPNAIQDKVREKYVAGLQNQFESSIIDNIQQGLSTQLENVGMQQTSALDLLNQDIEIYNWLMSALMFAKPAHFDAATVKDVLSDAWKSDALMQTKLSLYDDLVQFGIVPQSIDMDLVAKARALLLNQPAAIRAFFALRAKTSFAGINLGNFNAKDIDLSVPEIDGFYTSAAAKYLMNAEQDSSLEKTLQNSWVLDDSTPNNIDKNSIAELQNQVNQFYWSQYYTTWQNTLAALSIKPFSSILSAENFLSDAKAPDSSFNSLWQRLYDNLSVVNPQYFPADAKLKAFAQQMQTFLSSQQNNQQISTALESLSANLQSSQNDALTLAAAILNQKLPALGQLQTLAQNAPSAIQNILNQLIIAIVETVFAQAEHELEVAWQSQINDICKKVATYPDPEAFTDLFSKEGGAANLIGSSSLMSVIDIQNGQIINRSAYGVSFHLPEALQENLIKLLLIRDVFFVQGKLNLCLTFTPMYLSKNLAAFSVDDQNQSLFYQNGPRIGQQFNWPENSGDVTVKFTTLNGKTVSQTYSGICGLIQFLNSATVKVIDPLHYALTFNLGQYSATYELSARHGNFAGVLALKSFKCK